ncbi:MAG TPA: PhoH family protein [Sphaerochaeta sp.]|nr:MAG: phosphate starvation-inducible protein PhoH [Spirochaetes bacterium GWC2_52_13]PKL20354.1 MAG: PhoH family protein [Spirochaetae bacterium HGW-Spirochaetae-4]HCG64239.1 PhoH family protein [Sphaerochaeta sp.]HCJ93763.1 PhoH family protein [Sphaerochaeta sp.]HCS37283.1 PhoH family protein [Sphaerochaeta sp.]
MSSTIVFEQSLQMQRVCGVNDRNIPYIELLLNGELFVHGNSITYRDVPDREGSGDAVFTNLMIRLKRLAEQREDITEPEIFMEYQALQVGKVRTEADIAKDLQDEQNSFISVGGKIVYPKSSRQRTFIRLMRERQLVFSIGPAGTGKTFLAIAHALGEVLGGRKQKIILTRPVVEAGESLGFLPGDLTQKIGPYLRPLYDAMEYLLPPAIIKRLEDNGAVETAPLAYMRGRSLNNACVILDEAQNTTTEQMKMFLTRLSENSTAVITGDVTQVDLPRSRKSGLVHAAAILHDVPGIGFVEFDSSDVVRSRMVQRIIDAYEKDAYRS